jgi:serine/threonine-protein kinase
MRQRFLREARAASAVEHPNVLEVRDIFEVDGGTPVMVMDLLEGETLGQRIARDGQLSLPNAADILAQVVSGVGTAHSAGVVHRDLKPDNVFIVRAKDGTESVRVLDFGIAKLVGPQGTNTENGMVTGTGVMLGTPCYMSPEQSSGEKDIDHRTDIWSIGAILYETLSGARPVEGDSIGQVVKRLIVEGITPISVLLPTLPADMVHLIDRMLCREREGRPQDLREVNEVLARYATRKVPDFGPASAPRPEAVAAFEEVPVPRVVADSGADPLARTEQVPSNPETAGAQTMSAAGTRRAPGKMWLVAPSASAVAAPSSEPAAPPRVEEHTGRPSATPAGARRPVAAAAVAAPAAPSAAPAAPAPPPAAQTPRVSGGLAQKPPF